MVWQVSEDLNQPGLRIHIIEFASLDQRIDSGGALSASVGARERPVASANGNAAHSALGGIVGKTDAAIMEEARERFPAIEAIIDGLGDLALV